VTTTVAAPATAAPGRSVSVPVTFSNLGPAPATGVRYSLSLPPGLSGVGCGGATCSYDSATGVVTVTGLPSTLAAGQTAGFTLRYTAPARGSVTVTSTVITTATDGNPNNNSASGRTTIIGAPVDIPALSPIAMLALLGLLLSLGWRYIGQSARQRKMHR